MDVYTRRRYLAGATDAPQLILNAGTDDSSFSDRLWVTPPSFWARFALIFRFIKQLEAEQAPLRKDLEERARAAKRVETARRAVDRAPTRSRRLEDANKAEADKAAIDKSAERGCRENCRQLRQAQVDATATEVKDAQDRSGCNEAEGGGRARGSCRLGQPQGSSFADIARRRPGIPAWIIDLIQSALGSIAANVLACCLIVFSAHSPRRGKLRSQRRRFSFRPRP